MIIKFGVPLTYQEKIDKEREYNTNMDKGTIDNGEKNGFCRRSKSNGEQGYVEKHKT